MHSWSILPNLENVATLSKTIQITVVMETLNALNQESEQHFFVLQYSTEQAFSVSAKNLGI